jgi:glutamate synthase domain-containing protein 3
LPSMVSDHGCECMTGGLGSVYDEDGSFLEQARNRDAFLMPENWERLDDEARKSIGELVKLHAGKTASTRAQWLLANWRSEALKFVRLMPKPYA